MTHTFFVDSYFFQWLIFFNYSLVPMTHFKFWCFTQDSNSLPPTSYYSYLTTEPSYRFFHLSFVIIYTGQSPEKTSVFLHTHTHSNTQLRPFTHAHTHTDSIQTEHTHSHPRGKHLFIRINQAGNRVWHFLISQSNNIYIFEMAVIERAF